jgi:hypothetical protein
VDDAVRVAHQRSQIFSLRNVASDQCASHLRQRNGLIGVRIAYESLDAPSTFSHGCSQPLSDEAGTPGEKDVYVLSVL